MKKKYILTIPFWLIMLLSYHLHGQGCSDAGFCTLSSFKPVKQANAKSFSSQLKAGISYGRADNSIAVIGSYLEYNRQIRNSIGISAKITSLGQSGNNISVFNLSDIYFTADYKTGKQTQLSGGVKIPFANGNNTRNKLPLPLDYQSSLGTFDIIAGLKHTVKSFQLTAAIQQPVVQNKNRFVADEFPEGTLFRNFQSTNRFKRSGDILARVDYFFSATSKIKISPGLLAIYHLKNDRFTNTAGVEKEITGSQGLTLNANLYFDFMVSNKSSIQLSFGSPFITRDVRPDGLTWSFVSGIEYKISF
jgi:hypothetical protein